MAINSADFSVSSTGDIRHTGTGTTVYTVFDLHTWLQGLASSSTTTGDDVLSILSSNPSKIAGPRATNKPMSITLLNGYNVDDATAQYFKYGSIEQASGATLYTGVASIGSPLVAASPIYIYQNATRVTSYWGNPGHIQILIKAKAASTLIDSGNIRAFSRKWAQTFADFPANLEAGSEQPVAISTAVDTNIGTTTLATALAYSSNVTLSYGTTTLDLNNGNGARTYKGTIALDGTISLLKLYQYLQAICSDGQTTTVNSVAGQFYRMLDTTNYSANSAAPFGSYAGGKYLFAQGWKVTGVMTDDAINYQLIDDGGTTQSPPTTSTISIGGLVVGDAVLVGRDTGTDINKSEYTLSAAVNASTSVVMTTTIKTDTPASGNIRIGGIRYAYASWTGSTFTLSAAATIATATVAFVPFIDKTAASTTETASFTYSASFTARIKVRLGTGTSAIVPFETTLTVPSGTASVTTIRNLDV